MAERGGGRRGRGERSASSGPRGRELREEEGTAAAGLEVGAGGTGEEGAAGGPVGDSGGDGGMAGGSGSCGRTGCGERAPACPSPPGRCGAGWQGGGCGRSRWGAWSVGWGWAT